MKEWRSGCLESQSALFSPRAESHPTAMGTEPVSAGSRWAGKNGYASPPRQGRFTISPACTNVTLLRGACTLLRPSWTVILSILQNLLLLSMLFSSSIFPGCRNGFFNSLLDQDAESVPNHEFQTDTRWNQKNNSRHVAKSERCTCTRRAMGCFAPRMMERLLPFDPGCLR